MNNKVKIYGDIINTWKAFDESKNREVNTQYEIEFTEYNLDGSISRTGTEDFSVERYNTTFKSQWVWIWDGQKRNKGGHRWFECKGLIRYSSTQRKALNQYLKNKYPEAEVIQIRSW